MALHRDIFWVGRQWAVTGCGMQAIDQKQKGKFDIEISRVWDDGLADAMRAEGWLNVADFDRALTVARAHFPPPPGTVPPLQDGVQDPKELNFKESELKLNEDPVAQPKPSPKEYNMRIESWPAKFVTAWRIRVRR